MAEIVTKATLADKIHSSHSKGWWEGEVSWRILNPQIHRDNILLSGPISELRLTERQKCMNAGGKEDSSLTMIYRQCAQSETGNQWGWGRTEKGLSLKLKWNSRPLPSPLTFSIHPSLDGVVMLQSDDLILIQRQKRVRGLIHTKYWQSSTQQHKGTKRSVHLFTVITKVYS